MLFVHVQRLLCEALVDLLVVAAADVLEKKIRLGAQLHVAVLYAVVNHLRVMAASSITNPVAARSS
jgi:hypothetical protein